MQHFVFCLIGNYINIRDRQRNQKISQWSDTRWRRAFPNYKGTIGSYEWWNWILLDRGFFQSSANLIYYDCNHNVGFQGFNGFLDEMVTIHQPLRRNFATRRVPWAVCGLMAPIVKKSPWLRDVYFVMRLLLNRTYGSRKGGLKEGKYNLLRIPLKYPMTGSPCMCMSTSVVILQSVLTPKTTPPQCPIPHAGPPIIEAYGSGLVSTPRRHPLF